MTLNTQPREYYAVHWRRGLGNIGASFLDLVANRPTVMSHAVIKDYLIQLSAQTALRAASFCAGTTITASRPELQGNGATNKQVYEHRRRDYPG